MAESTAIFNNTGGTENLLAGGKYEIAVRYKFFFNVNMAI